MTHTANTDTVRLYDADNQLVDEVQMPKRQPGEDPRSIIYMGKKYLEGGGPGKFYDKNEFYEVPQ